MYPLTIDGFCKVNKPSPGKCRGMAIFRRKKKYSAVNWCLKESNAHRPYCRGGIHASRVHGAFSPNGAKKRDVSPPGGINASPTVYFATFSKQPDKHQFAAICAKSGCLTNCEAAALAYSIRPSPGPGSGWSGRRPRWARSTGWRRGRRSWSPRPRLLCAPRSTGRGLPPDPPEPCG